MDKKSYSTIITFLVLIFIGVAYLIFSDLPIVSNNDLGAQAYSSLSDSKTPKVLQKGVNGEAVKDLQAFLAKEGLYKGSADGKFGPTTESAVKSFQTKYGLKPSGSFGGGGSQEVSCEVDVNNDGAINTADLSGLVASFGSQGSDLAYDLNNDGVVGSGDLTILLQYFGQELNCTLLVLDMSSYPIFYNVDIPGSVSTDLELFDFTLSVVGSEDVLVSQIPIFIDIEGVLDDSVGVSNVVNSLTLSDNQGNFTTVDVQLADDNDIEVFYFDFSSPIEIDGGDTVNFTLEANIKGFNDNEVFTEGTEIQAYIHHSYADQIQAESAQNGVLSNEQIEGSAHGDIIGLFREGINVQFMSSSTSGVVVDGDSNDIGTFVINFDVTAFSEGMLIPVDASLSSSSWLEMPGIADDIDDIKYSMLITLDGTNYIQEGSEMASELSSVLTSDADIVQGHYHIEEGETESFQLTVTKENNGEDTGPYKMYLTGIPWIGDDWFNDDQEIEYYYIYKYLEGYHTSHIYLN